MKYYAQFYDYNLKGELSEPCGDRAVIILDGRMTKANMGAIAACECKKRGYIAWAIFQGTFTTSRRISQVWYVSKGVPDNTAVSASYGA